MDPAYRKTLKLLECGASSVKLSRVSDALQYFALNEISQSQPLPTDFPVKPVLLGRRSSPEVIDSHGDIDQRHEASGTRLVRDSSRFPSQRTAPLRRRMTVCA